MCETCGCGDPEIVPIEVKEEILSGNNARAAHNREHFVGHGVVAINLMGSPGAGKTALLEATAKADAELKLAALAGDLETHRDAERLDAAGIRSVPITTGSACHLDARLVHRALHDLEWHDVDTLFIENVGNLVCPAIYDLGEARNVVALSVTEGEDKPLKYPVMFRKADLVLITKVDLVPHLPGFDIDRLEENLAKVMPNPSAIRFSSTNGEGIPAWLEWMANVRQTQAVPAEA